MTKVAIIGAGPCGLSMLRAFEHLEKKGEKICKRYSPVVTTLLALMTLVLIGALVVVCLWKFEVL